MLSIYIFKFAIRYSHHEKFELELSKGIRKKGLQLM